MTNRPSLALAVLTTLALAAPAGAHEQGAHAPHAIATSTTRVAAESSPMPLAARFELKTGAVGTDWYLWREADRIETADAASGQSQIWQRLDNGQFQMRRVFHKDRSVVEFVPGELKTRNMEPDWTKLESVVSPHLLEGLTRGASRSQFGQKAIHYRGRIAGQEIDLWWLEQARLPARLRIVNSRQTIALTLKELYGTAPASWPRADESAITGYRLIDAADLGDMEYDPFVARLLLAEGHYHGHGGHNH